MPDREATAEERAVAEAIVAERERVSLDSVGFLEAKSLALARAAIDALDSLRASRQERPPGEYRQVIERALTRQGKGGVRDGGTGEILSNAGTAAKATRRLLDDLAEAGFSLVKEGEQS